MALALGVGESDVATARPAASAVDPLKARNMHTGLEKAEHGVDQRSPPFFTIVTLAVIIAHFPFRGQSVQGVSDQ